MASSSSAIKGMRELHVLVVADNHTERRVAERMFVTNGCRVTTAMNGTDALEIMGLADGEDDITKINNANVDFIVTDYHMPEMTGMELFKIIKESPLTKDMPIAIMSYESQDHFDECLKEGVCMYLPKPIKQSEVIILIDFVSWRSSSDEE